MVLLVSGLSTSSLVWAGMTRLLSPSLRVYSYDRSGYGKSELSPLAPSAENIALELSLLVKYAHIENPLILVVHSWGGVIAREFVVRSGDGPQIAGLVFVDANQECTLELLNWTDPNLFAVFDGVDPNGAKGLRSGHKMTQEEWDAYENEEATEKHMLQAIKEFGEYGPSFETLRKKELNKREQPLLGEKPVYVIMGLWSKDLNGLYKAGVEKGNGTEEQRRAVREMADTAEEKNEILQKEHLSLSTKGKFVIARGSGHFIQLTEPELIVDGVKWVLNESSSSA